MNFTLKLTIGWELVAFPAAILVGLLFAISIFRIGRGGFSPRLFGVAVTSGAMVGFVAAFIEGGLGVFSPGSGAPWAVSAYKAYVLAGGVEEAVKLGVMLIFVLGYFDCRNPRDVILGAMTVGLGFALVENVFYVLHSFSTWESTAMLRTFISVPEHIFLGVVLGCGVAFARESQGRASKFIAYFAAWLSPAMLHGSFDFPLMVAGEVYKNDDVLERHDMYFSDTLPSTLMLQSSMVILVTSASAAIVMATLIWAGVRAKNTHDLQYQIRPKILDRLFFADTTGRLVGAICVGFSVAWLFLVARGVSLGVANVFALHLISFGVGILVFGGAIFVNAKPKGARRRGLGVDSWALLALTAATVGAVYAFATPLGADARLILAAELRDSGDFLVVDGELERARLNYVASGKLGVDSVEMWVKSALIHRLYQRYDLENAEITRALAFTPGAEGLLLQRSESFENIHDFDGALRDVDQALSKHPDNVAFLTHKARYLREKGENTQSREVLDRVFILKPNSSDAMMILANLESDRRDRKVAIAELSKVIAQEPRADEAYFARSQIYYAMGDNAHAIADLSRARELGESPYVVLWQNFIHEKLGLGSNPALRGRRIELTPQPWPFPLIDFYAGRIDEARVFALAGGPDQVCEANFYVGEMKSNRGDLKGALEMFAHAEQHCPDDFIEKGAASIELDKAEGPGRARAFMSRDEG